MLKVILAACILFVNQTPLHEDNVIQFVNKQYGIIIRGIYSEHRDYISNFTVAFKGKQSEIFQWRNSSLRNPSLNPRLYYKDITQDGQNEIVIVNIVDHGTGIIISEAHVLDSNTLKEIPVIPLKDIINQEVKFRGRQVYIEQKVIFEADRYGDIRALFEDWINYIVEGNKLIGAVRIGDGRFEQYAGYLEVGYRYKNGKFVGHQIKHVKDLDMHNTEGSSLQLKVTTNET